MAIWKSGGLIGPVHQEMARWQSALEVLAGAKAEVALVGEDDETGGFCCSREAGCSLASAGDDERWRNAGGCAGALG